MNSTRPDSELNRIIAEWHTGQLFTVNKHGMFYLPNAHGYTSDIKEAWKLPYEDAKKHEYNPKGCVDPVTIHPAPIPDYCSDANAIDAEVRRLDFNDQCSVCEEIARRGFEEACYTTRSMATCFAPARVKAEALVAVIEEGRR